MLARLRKASLDRSYAEGRSEGADTASNANGWSPFSVHRSTRVPICATETETRRSHSLECRR